MLLQFVPRYNKHFGSFPENLFMEVFDITNKLPQSLGSPLNRGSTVLNPALYRTVKITISYLQ